jgi:hypothetical protein
MFSGCNKQLQALAGDACRTETEENTGRKFLSACVAMVILFFHSPLSTIGQTSTIGNFKTLDTAVSFAGYWLNESYYNNIKEFGSPRKAERVGNCKFVIIPERTLMKTIMICDFHEETYFTKILKNRSNYELWGINEDGLAQRKATVQFISQNKIKIGNENYIKISPSNIKDNMFHSSIENQYLILEQILFKGQYITADGKKVEFKSNGQVMGLDNFHFYSPIAIYFNDEGLQVDQVIFSKSEKGFEWNDLEWLPFKFKKDTLELYKPKCLDFDSTNQRCARVDFGKLIYKMWRKNN